MLFTPIKRERRTDKSQRTEKRKKEEKQSRRNRERGRESKRQTFIVQKNIKSRPRNADWRQRGFLGYFIILFGKLHTHVQVTMCTLIEMAVMQVRVIITLPVRSFR